MFIFTNKIVLCFIYTSTICVCREREIQDMDIYLFCSLKLCHLCTPIRKSTAGTRNKEQVGKRRFAPYGMSFPYCESSSLIKLNFGQH